MNQSQQILSTAADIVEHVGWCQGAFAKDDKGRDVLVSSSTAIAFCSLGAIESCAVEAGASQYSDHRPIADLARADLASALEHGSIAEWNDRPGQTAENVANTMRLAAYKLGPL